MKVDFLKTMGNVVGAVFLTMYEEPVQWTVEGSLMFASTTAILSMCKKLITAIGISERVRTHISFTTSYFVLIRFQF